MSDQITATIEDKAIKDDRSGNQYLELKLIEDGRETGRTWRWHANDDPDMDLRKGSRYVFTTKVEDKADGKGKWYNVTTATPAADGARDAPPPDREPSRQAPLPRQTPPVASSKESAYLIAATLLGPLVALQFDKESDPDEVLALVGIFAYRIHGRLVGKPAPAPVSRPQTSQEEESPTDTNSEPLGVESPDAWWTEQLKRTGVTGAQVNAALGGDLPKWLRDNEGKTVEDAWAVVEAHN